MLNVICRPAKLLTIERSSIVRKRLTEGRESPPYGPLFVLAVLPVVFLVANLPHNHPPITSVTQY